VDEDDVQAWLDGYVRAWMSYDPEEVGALWSDDAVHSYGPFDEPVRGRDAIVASWLEDRDATGTYEARYEPLLVAGDRAVANGRSRYFKEDGSLRDEYDNIFSLRFDGDGRCTEFREWFMRRPKQEQAAADS